MEGGLKREVKAHFGKSLLIEDKETNVLIHQIDLENILWASVRYKFHKTSTLSLGLPFGKIMKFRLSKEEIGGFLSNVLHSNECPLLIDFNIPEMKIECDVDGEIDPGFEASLVKKMEDGLPDVPKTFSQGLLNALLTGSINLSFASAGYDLKLVAAFADALKRLAKFIESSEADPDMVKEFQDFTSSPSKSKQPKQSLGNLKAKRVVPSLYSAYTRIAPLMCILRTLLSKREAAPDLALYSGLTAAFIGVSKTRHPVVSYLASSCLRVMFKVIQGRMCSCRTRGDWRQISNGSCRS
eukprot:TRINITY_DN13411_c0_g2_i12.p1 TRINITY_DN13411_c0_g2~~TRINITY_DN13411_c0_g2_i12.p1  ORF type:complete len:297 (+),score=56.95 TRINITY_DN13411_c0_g2_i12:712-1602(+)